MVQKPVVNKFRMTVEVRKVYDRTERSVWPMPLLEAVTKHLNGSKVVFALNFFKGYSHLSLSMDSQEKLSFITDQRVYTPSLVLMDGRDSVAYCQSAVQQTFGKLLYKNLPVCLGDLLVNATTSEQLLTRLEDVFTVCEERGLKLNPEKSKFWKISTLWC